jgi:23S rRNA (guanosine2251-2'-O)-methyltransferase
MNVEIKNIHTIHSLLENHCEKVISLSGQANSMKEQEVLELAHKKGVKIQAKSTKITALCKSPNVHDLKSSNYDLGKLVLILDEVQDTRNLGSCLRSASFFGVDAIIIPKNNSADYANTAVIETSTGGVYDLKLYKATNITNVIKELKNYDYWVSGFSEHAASALESKDFSGKNVLIFGNEEKGMRSLVEKNCDDTLKIKQRGIVSSLNVSVAVSIGLHNISNKL